MLPLPVSAVFQLFALIVNFVGIGLNVIVMKAFYQSRKNKSAIDWILSCNINLLTISLSFVFIVTEISNFVTPIAKNPFLCASQGILTVSLLCNLGALVYITSLSNLFTVITTVKPSPRSAVTVSLVSAVSSLFAGLLSGGYLGGPFRLTPAPSGLYCAMKMVNTTKPAQVFNILVIILLLGTPVFVTITYILLIRNISKLFDKLSQSVAVSRAAKDVARNVVWRGIFVAGGAAVALWGIGFEFAYETATNNLVSPIVDGFVATLVHLISIVTGCCFIINDKDSTIQFSRTFTYYVTSLFTHHVPVGKANEAKPKMKSNLVIGAKTAALLASPQSGTLGPQKSIDIESATLDEDYTIFTPIL